MFEDKTTDELRLLQEKYLEELTKKEPAWKAAYYVFGLLAAMGGIFLAFRDGIGGFSALLILLGLPAVWMWKRDDRLRSTTDDLYRRATFELAKRRGEI